jgi:hypothetical protein
MARRVAPLEFRTSEPHFFVAERLSPHGGSSARLSNATFPFSGGFVKIAQVAPLIEQVPPKLYGGTERVVSYLTEELVPRGHDVTLFASDDSVTAATLVPGAPKALRLDPAVRDPLPHTVLLLERVRQRTHEFDAIHFHTDLVHFPMFRSLASRSRARC